MSAGRPSQKSRPRRPAPLARVAVLLALAVVVFLAGLALGQALEETPPPGGTQTVVRTLPPLEPPATSAP